MSAPTRVKITRSTLIQRLETAKVAELARYEAEHAKHDAAIMKFCEKLEHDLEGFMDLLTSDPAKALERVETYHRTKCATVTFHTHATKPTLRPADLTAINNLLKLLEASADEYLAITKDDAFARYIFRQTWHQYTTVTQ
jgi:hypothetical protein